MKKAGWPLSLAGLVQAADGNLYGTFLAIGAHGEGSVFKITPARKIRVVYSFCSQAGCADGYQPNGSLIQADDGNLYGTTTAGGVNGNNGTVFKLSPEGVLTTLHSFDGADGAYPVAGLVQASDGNFYGTTQLGGIGACSGGCGTIFKITRAGALTNLYKFCSLPNCADGEYPVASLIEAGDGNLYGTTQGGGSGAFNGTIFRMTLSGSVTNLYRFCPDTNCSDGYSPRGGLVQATDGNLYGTTADGGGGGGRRSSGGTIFKVDLNGNLTTTYRFCIQRGCPDGTGPVAPLIQATDGNLYGTTLGGTTASGDLGTVFKLSVGLGPFVTPLPSAAKVGKQVTFLGPNLTGATGVTFSGVPAASFTVNSSGSAISTRVPTGATSGTIQVLLPNGALTSNVPFPVER